MHPSDSPRLTVDLIIQIKGDAYQIVLVKRRHPPAGWALPGGFVNYGETVEEAAAREAFEETSLQVKLLHQFYVYSDPQRDPRGHTVSVVFIASAEADPVGGDDAAEARVFHVRDLPQEIAFDHCQIIQDYIERRY
jgi:ADP-ribose pyrophosphatase YjhB (NUDIX family)